MILTTTPQIEGHVIKEYKGIVAADSGKSSFTYNEKTKDYEYDASTFDSVKNDLLSSLKDDAEKLFANAIVGISIHFKEYIDEESLDSSYLTAFASGTAVVID